VNGGKQSRKGRRITHEKQTNIVPRGRGFKDEGGSKEESWRRTGRLRPANSEGETPFTFEMTRGKGGPNPLGKTHGAEVQLGGREVNVNKGLCENNLEKKCSS